MSAATAAAMQQHLCGLQSGFGIAGQTLACLVFYAQQRLDAGVCCSLLVAAWLIIQ
jgi:hypothetical protein